MDLVAILDQRREDLRAVEGDVGRDFGPNHDVPVVDEGQPLAEPRLSWEGARLVRDDHLELRIQQLHQQTHAAQVVHDLLDRDEVELLADPGEELPGPLGAAVRRPQLPDVERPKKHRPIDPLGEPVPPRVRRQLFVDALPLGNRKLRHTTLPNVHERDADAEIGNARVPDQA